jgi:DNA helicase II / ATP-dependent DNA helicase PcrA
MTEGRQGVLDRVILNQVQKDAVAWNEGPQLVFAGAGTGKTRVLTAKIAWLIREQDVPPHNIFAATFTNKAAREMRTRVEALLDTPCEALWIGTFHSLCARILRREARHTVYSPWFTIYDADDQARLIKGVMKRLELDERTMTPAALLGAVSRFKSKCLQPQEAADGAAGFYEQQVVRSYKAYQEALEAAQAMDFDDLISNTVYLFRSNEAVLGQYRTAFRHILVDEYQDTNTAQFLLVKILGEAHGRVFAVGDDDQSIYGWRGAEVENILSFEKAFKGTRVFKLEQNYRSTPAILNFANAAIAPNAHRAPKKLWTSRTGGDEVTVTQCADDRQEASVVCDEIGRLQQKGSKLSDVMILFRTNAQSRSFEDALRKRNIPYVFVGGMSFYHRKEIKDCLAYLRLAVNIKDDVGFERIMNVPARSLGDKAYETLAAIARLKGKSLAEMVIDDPSQAGTGRSAKGIAELRAILIKLRDDVAAAMRPDEIFNDMVTITGYLDMLGGDDAEESETRIDNVNELMNAVAVWTKVNPDKGLAAFLEEISLVSDIDTLDESKGVVSMMTLHAAKGLETAHVFLAGVEDGLLPTRSSFDDERKIEEERRLLYVGSTRAMKTLWLGFATQRWRFGSVMPMEPSRFLSAIPSELYRFTDLSNMYAPPMARRPAGAYQPEPRGSRRPPGGYSQPAEPPRNPMPAYEDFSQAVEQFRMGQHVRHGTYGTGRILSISGFGDDMRMVVLFGDGQRRKMIAKFANLEAA